MLVGAALGMSGAVFQSIARNPLGSPDIIGFESGAAFGAVVVIVVVGGTSSQVAMGAVAGGLVTALLVYVLAWKQGWPRLGSCWSASASGSPRPPRSTT